MFGKCLKKLEKYLKAFRCELGLKKRDKKVQKQEISPKYSDNIILSKVKFRIEWPNSYREGKQKTAKSKMLEFCEFVSDLLHIWREYR